MPTSTAASRDLRLLSRHGSVLVETASDSEISVSALAERLRLSTRSVRRIISELEAACLLERVRAGNRNRYRLNEKAVTNP